MLNKLYLVMRALTPKQHIQLGRWRLKHDSNQCEIYFNNYHGEPGYPNKHKDEWIKKLKKSE